MKKRAAAARVTGDWPPRADAGRTGDGRERSCSGLSSGSQVSLPKLTRIGGYLDVSANKVLTRFRLPALETVNDRDLDSAWDVAIKDNALLPACEAEAVRDRLLARGYNGTISVSGTAGTCSP
jgi:hypothetical protein